jgi:Fur family peroxide stress response transcriptional regulator
MIITSLGASFNRQKPPKLERKIRINPRNFFIFPLQILIIIIIIVLRDDVKMITGQCRKHSKKREAILRVIQSTSAHPSAQWVYNTLKPSIPGLSLATVYRNLSLFREEGAVASLGVVGGEERFDGEVRPHPHFVCRRCGRVEDLPCPSPETLKSIAGEAGGEGPAFIIDYRRTVFYGLCGECIGECINEESPAPESPGGVMDSKTTA